MNIIAEASAILQREKSEVLQANPNDFYVLKDPLYCARQPSLLN